MSEVAGWILALGQQVWQQREEGRNGGASVCFFSIAPFLLGAAAVGLRSIQSRLRRMPIPSRGESQSTVEGVSAP